MTERSLKTPSGKSATRAASARADDGAQHGPDGAPQADATLNQDRVGGDTDRQERDRAFYRSASKRLRRALSGLAADRLEWGYLFTKPILYSAVIAIIIGVFISITGYRAEELSLRAKIRQIDTHASVMGRQIGTFDYGALEDSLSLLMSDPFVLAVEMVDRSGHTIRLVQEGQPGPFTNPHIFKREIRDPDDATRLAELTVWTERRPLSTVLLHGLGLALVTFGLFFALSLALISGYTLSHVVQPLRELRKTIDQTVSTGRPSTTTLDHSSHIGKFALDFNRMQERLTDIQTELLDKNRALQDLSALNSQHVTVMGNVLSNVASFVRHYGPDGTISDYGVAGLDGLHDLLPPRFEPVPEKLVQRLTSRGGEDAGTRPDIEVARIVAKDSRVIADSLYQIDVTTADKREFMLSAHALRNDDFFYLWVDTTERKRIEKEVLQSSKMEALGVLVSGITHDFNNLIMIVASTLELCLEQDEMTAQLRGRLEAARAASMGGAEFIRSILAYSRSKDTGIAPCNLSALAENIVNMVTRGLPSTVTLTAEIQPDVYVIANEPMLETAILNLINNASDATGAKGLIRLRVIGPAVSDETDGRSGDMASIIVEDNGPGVPPDLRSKIFDPFFTTKEIGKGTGLGLSLVAGMARSVGGSCTYDDSDQDCTRFILRLPLAAGRITAPEVVPKTSTAPQDLTVLLVEDDTAVRNIIGQALEHDGWQVLTAATFHEAETILRSDFADSLDVVLTDYELPDGSGLQLCRLYADHLPFVLMSGKISVDMAQHDGVSAFLRKPFPASSTGDVLRDAIARS